MKRFLLFRGNHFYPYGGWSDYDQSFDTAVEAIAYMSKLRSDRDYQDYRYMEWYQVIDAINGTVVAHEGCNKSDRDGRFDSLALREADEDWL